MLKLVPIYIYTNIFLKKKFGRGIAPQVPIVPRSLDIDTTLFHNKSGWLSSGHHQHFLLLFVCLFWFYLFIFFFFFFFFYINNIFGSSLLLLPYHMRHTTRHTTLKNLFHWKSLRNISFSSITKIKYKYAVICNIILFLGAFEFEMPFSFINTRWCSTQC